MTPLLVKVVSKRVGVVGFQPLIPLIAEFEESAPYVIPAADTTADVPVDGMRKVQVGT
jgi:hypothetical protein